MLPIQVPRVFGKLLTRRGAWAWFHDLWTCGAKVFEYWMIFSLKPKLNCRGDFRKNWNVHLVFLERSWWAGINGIYLVRFGFQMQEILILKWFFMLKIPMMMIIGTGLYRPSIGFFFITKTITPWSSIIKITNGCLIENYVLEWSFLTIMCWNYESLGIFFGVNFWQWFENYEDCFHVVVIVCLAIFNECLFLS
jgi:hypothetical protein